MSPFDATVISVPSGSRSKSGKPGAVLVNSRVHEPSGPIGTFVERTVSQTTRRLPGVGGAIVSVTVSANADDRHVYLMNTDGTGVRQLTRGGTPSFQAAWKP